MLERKVFVDSLPGHRHCRYKTPDEPASMSSIDGNRSAMLWVELVVPSQISPYTKPGYAMLLVEGVPGAGSKGWPQGWGKECFAVN